MASRELVVLGTASQVPTRYRNHNGYLLRWDREAILFDPGEGTQRQFTLAGVSPRHIDRICLTHLHGDHCLGLPGMLERLAQDDARGQAARAHGGDPGPLPIHFPASGRPYVERLCDASIGRAHDVRLDPVEPPTDGEAVVTEGPPLRITARSLVHEADAIGYRVEEPPSRHLVPARLDDAGIAGADIARLEAEGSLDRDGHTITLDAVSEMRPGHSVAVVMDTGVCDAAVALATGVDLLLCEATFLDRHRDLAASHGHLTARQAATIAREAGVGQLVLTHFSSRYDDADDHRREAEAVFDHVITAEDFAVVPFPRTEPM